MLDHFTHNEIFSRRLSESEQMPGVRSQLTEIIECGHRLALDWYFTRIPDLRCGRKEISRIRANASCYRIWIKNQNRFLVGETTRRRSPSSIPLSTTDVKDLFAFMKNFAETNPASRPLGGFLPDQYIQSDIIDSFESRVLKSLKGDRDTRLSRLEKAKRQPKQRHQKVIIFERNPDVVAESLYLANGKCQRCKIKAPFLKRKDGQPYLEVHHEIRLIEGGSDTLDNVIALCPNCHRELHYGNP